MTNDKMYDPTDICPHLKRTYHNGEITENRCLKLNKNIASDGCIDCTVRNNTTEDIFKSTQVSREEIFHILASSLNIFSEELDKINKRLDKLEGKE